MSFETYNVYFSGQIMKDQEAAAVREKLGKLFNLEGAKLEHLFSGQPVAIKKGIDMEQAVKYRVAFREAGALVDIRPGETAPAAPAPNPEPATQPTPQEGLSLSAPNSYDLSDCTAAVAAQPIPDISGLDLEKPGVILDSSSQAEPLVIDTDDLELDQPGITLDETPAAPVLDIDTADLTLNPANQGSLEEFQQPVTAAPLPNIDHLEIAEREEKPQGKAQFAISED